MTIEPKNDNVVRVGGVSLPAICAAIVCAVGATVLLEWTFNLKLLATFSPTDSSMKANTGIVFLLSGASLWLWQSRETVLHGAARVLSVLVLLVVTLILSQYLFGVTLGIDELFFRDHPNPDITSHPGRMSPIVTVNFILTGLCLLLWDKQTRAGIRIAEYLGLAAFLIPIVSTVGYLYSAARLYSFNSATGIALLTALTFLVFSIGLVAVKTKTGVMTILLSESRGGRILRLLLPFSLLSLLFFDYLAVQGARRGYYGETLITPVELLTSGAVITILFWFSARALHFSDLAEKVAARRLTTEHAVTRSIARAESFEEGSAVILETLCRQMGVDVCALWLPDGNDEQLYCAAIKSPDRSPEMASLKELSLKLQLKRGEGLPGLVWRKNELVWIEDLHDWRKFPELDEFPRAEANQAAGLHTAIGFPLRHGEMIVGVIEFFRRGKISYDQPLTEMFSAIGSEIGQFIERDRIERERELLYIEAAAARDAAEEASRMKDDFLAVVSHELRTPLNAILGWNRFLLMSPDEKMVRHVNEVVERQGKQQLQLIEDLLDTSRIISGKMRLNLETVELIKIIENALETVRPAAEAKKINLIADYDTTIPKISGDSDRLQQIIWNLISNAVKFTPDGGAVYIELKRSQEVAEIVVRDTGNGIEPDFVPFVFERFRQADASLTRRFGGLGLGLALVKHLTELHGGTVAVESKGINTGAAFFVRLPLKTNRI